MWNNYNENTHALESDIFLFFYLSCIVHTVFHIIQFPSDFDFENKVALDKNNTFIATWSVEIKLGWTE